jgi:hypothetical protein
VLQVAAGDHNRRPWSRTWLFSPPGGKLLVGQLLSGTVQGASHIPDLRHAACTGQHSGGQGTAPTERTVMRSSGLSSQ